MFYPHSLSNSVIEQIILHSRITGFYTRQIDKHMQRTNSTSSMVHYRHCLILYNYPSKGRKIVVDIILYQDAKHWGVYPPLFTDLEGDSCFSIYQIRWIKKCFFNFFFWNFREMTCHFSLHSQNSEYPRIIIPSYGSQSKCAKIPIYWFGKY